MNDRDERVSGRDLGDQGVDPLESETGTAEGCFEREQTLDTVPPRAHVDAALVSASDEIRGNLFQSMVFEVEIGDRNGVETVLRFDCDFTCRR